MDIPIHVTTVVGVEGKAEVDSEGCATHTGKRWIVSFRYTRRGQTSLWDQNCVSTTEIKPDMAWPGPGVRLAEHDERTELYDVAVEMTGEEDLEEVHDAAEELADAEFLRCHPEADLAV